MHLVRDFMTTNPVCVTDDDTMFDGRNKMREHAIRHLPVINKDKKFCGMLTQKIVLSNAIAIINQSGLENLESAERNINIRERVDNESISVEPDTPLLTAAKFFKQNRHGCIAVVENNQVVGVLTSSDFVTFAIEILQLENY